MSLFQRETGLTARLASIQDALNYVAPEPKTVPFAGWYPDLPALGNPGLTVARNVIPRKVGYGPLGDINPVSGALTARARGGTLAQDTSGNNYNYAGDATKLYEVRASGVTDKSGTTYSTADRDLWEFALFGNQLFATNFADPVQEITIGEAGNFADLITSTLTPKAKHIATVREWVFLGHTNDATDGTVPYRVWWSAYRDATDFDPDQATQCDYEDRPAGGAVQKILGGMEYGLSFQQRAISRITWAGLPAIFQFDEIDRTRGTPVSSSVIGWGRRAFFLADEGFYENDGTQSYPIGDEKLDRHFWAQFDVNNGHLMSAAVDPINNIVAWSYPAGGSVLPDRLLLYNWIERKWADAAIELDSLVQGTSEAYTLEELDAVFLDTDADTTLDANELSGQTTISVADETLFAAGDTVRIELNSGSYDQTTVDATPGSGGAGTIDIVDALTADADSGNRFVRTSIDAPGLPSLDSPIWKGGGLLFGGYDRDHKLGYFDGDNLAAMFETGEIQFVSGGSARLHTVRSLDDSSMGSIAVAGRDTQSEAVAFSAAIPIDGEGKADPDDEHRYHRIRRNIPAGATWTEAQGIEVAVGRAGNR